MSETTMNEPTKTESTKTAPTVTEPTMNHDKDQDTEIAGRLALVIGRLNRRMITGGTGLSHGLLSALSSLVKQGPLRLGDLAAQERVAAATVTRVVASLEGKGLATRTADPSDGRSFVIDATPAGAELVLRARSARAELIAHLVQSLDAADADILVRALPALEKLVTAELAVAERVPHSMAPAAVRSGAGA